MLEREYEYQNVSGYISEIIAKIIEKDEIAAYAGDVGLELKEGKVLLKISQN
jgi:hypothetical protein